ncbi:MAG: hypothetical protein QM776_09955 [Rhodocyclaceae bacterium]
MKKCWWVGVASVVLCVTGFVWFVFFTPPRIGVENASGETLGKLILTGSGFTKEMGELPPGAMTQTTVRPQGESGLSVSFDVRGSHHQQDLDTYFEGFAGYRVQIVIGQDLKARVVSVRTSL